MKVELSRRAVADVYWIADNFQDASAARRTLIAIRQALELLSEFPGKGRFRARLNSHAVIVRVRRRRYVVYYRMHAHIRDGRRAPVKPGEV